MPVLNLSRIAAFALSACLLAPASFAQGAGAGGETPQAAVLRPEIRTGKVIATLPEAQGTDVEARSADRGDPMTTPMHVACVDMNVTLTDEMKVRIGTEIVGGYRRLQISCAEVFDAPPGYTGAFIRRRSGEANFSFVFLKSDPASHSASEMYLAMAQDAMRLDRSLRIDYVQCDDRFGPTGCWNQILGITLYNDRRTSAY
jgi:hypothetical protein